MTPSLTPVPDTSQSSKSPSKRDFWRDWSNQFLDAARSPWYRTIVDVQDQLARSTTAFYAERGIKSLFLPLTTGSISSPMGLGSDSLPVPITLGGTNTYLADSMQFMLEFGCRIHEPGAFYMMPSFRGEAPDARHLSQFFHSEAEIPGGLEDVMALVEAYVKKLAADLAANLPDEIRRWAGTTQHLEDVAARTRPMERITVADAVALLRTHYPDEPSVDTHSLGFNTVTPHGEQLLMRHLGEFLWLERSDARSVPFYQALSSDGETTLNADLLFGLGEVVGSGERHPDGPSVRQALDAHQVDPAAYDWYVRMKQETPLRTAGFGMGVERFMAWVLGTNDIRELQLVPRAIGEVLVP